MRGDLSGGVAPENRPKQRHIAGVQRMLQASADQPIIAADMPTAIKLSCDVIPSWAKEMPQCNAVFRQAVNSVYHSGPNPHGCPCLA